MRVLNDGAKNVATRGRKQVKVNKTIRTLPFAPCVKMSRATRACKMTICVLL